MKKLTLADYPWVKEGTLDAAKPDWLAGPCGLSKHSDPLTESNFDAQIDKLDDADPMGKDWETVRYPHWSKAVEWYEVVFVRPGSLCEEIITQCHEKMKSFPCLDEDLWLKYESSSSTSSKEST